MSSKDASAHLIEESRGLNGDAFVRLVERGRTPAKEFVSIKDLAAELGVSVRTIRRWNNCSDAPPRARRGRRLMYRRADVQHWFGAARADGQDL